MFGKEMMFQVNDEDMPRFIEYMKETLDLSENDEIIVFDNAWRLIIAKK